MTIVELIEPLNISKGIKTRIQQALIVEGIDTVEALVDRIDTFKHIHSTAAKIDACLSDIPRIGTKCRRALTAAVAPHLFHDPRFAKLTGSPEIIGRLKRGLERAIERLESADLEADDLKKLVVTIDKEIA